MTDAVTVKRDGGVLEITLDRPKANAIDAATSRALGAAFVTLRDDPDLRVGILTGGGARFFSAGWDLKAAAAGSEAGGDHGPGGFAGITELFDLEKPVIAAVNGLAVGGGFEMALACDLIVAAESAEFWLPEARLGIMADGGGVLRMARRIPRNIAAELLMTCRHISAAEAARWGLVNRVVPADRLMAAARAMAQEILVAAPLSIAALKAVMRETECLALEAAYAQLRSGKIETYQRMHASADAKEGPQAFAEKRDPVWQGR